MDNDFSKSRIGKKFFESDLPQLISVLGKLTEAMTTSNKIEEKKLLIEQKRFLNEQRESRSEDTNQEFTEK
jgi:hypothetical protein